MTARGKTTTSAADGNFTLDVAGAVGEAVLAEKDGYIGAQRRVDGPDKDGFGTLRLEVLSLDSPNAPPVPPGG